MTIVRLFGYYAVHSIKNQIKKLFKTWVAILMIVCLVLGAIIGMVAGVLDGAFDEDIPVDGAETVEPAEPDGSWKADFSAVDMGCGIVALLTLGMFSFAAFRADKSGCEIFTSPDVNILFPAPIKPQSVLLFKLMCQLGASVVASVYLLFQIPNAMVNLGMTLPTVIAAISAWIFILLFMSLIQILLFTLGSTKLRIKKYIRPVVYAVLLATAFGFVMYWKNGGGEPLNAAVAYFSSDIIQYIPIYGWIVGLFKSAMMSDLVLTGVYFALLTLALIVTVRVIWCIKADFYEEAMARSEQTAELLRGAEEGLAVKSKDKKDRSDKLKRDGLKFGEGANIYFFKAMYNRFRFAHFKVFTKTSETYLVSAVGVALVLRLGMQINTFVPIALTLGVLAFFRSLGNPISKDIELNCFIMIPEKSYKKIFYSMLAGASDCLLDLMPGMIISGIILGENIFVVFAWMLFIATIDFYSSGVTTFLELSISVTVAKQVKQVIAIMFIYFGLLPNAIIIIIGLILEQTAMFALICALFSFGLGAIFSYFSSLLLDRGRK